MIKFNSDNIIVGEIKQLLKTFNLPTCKVFVPGMFILEGEIYLHGLHLYRARKSGFLNEINKENFETLQLYKYGEKIPGITKTYALDSLIYDEHLHRYLGEYLRFYSDYYGINLMSLYNCFSNKLIPYMNFGKAWTKDYQDVLVETESGNQEVYMKKAIQFDTTSAIEFVVYEGETEPDYFFNTRLNEVTGVACKNLTGPSSEDICLISNYMITDEQGHEVPDEGNYDLWIYDSVVNWQGRDYAKWIKWENEGGPDSWDDDLHETAKYILTNPNLYDQVLETLEDESGGEALHQVAVETSVITTSYNSITDTTNFKVYAVPINLFKEYTIGVDCDTTLELMLDFYDQDNEIVVVNKAVMDKLHNYSYVAKSGTIFSRPFLYTKALFEDIDFGDSVLKEFMKQEPSFRLLIKVPAQCNSSISVVEGNYVKNCEKVFNKRVNGKSRVGNVQITTDDIGVWGWVKEKDPETGEEKEVYKELYKIKTPIEDYYYPTKMELFRLNTQIQHPFANRLVEYLVDNVISNEDSIGKNIERVQLSLYHPKVIDGVVNRRLPVIKNRGIWQEDMKVAIYRDSINEDTINKYFDLLYYVDKDVETDIIKEASD